MSMRATPLSLDLIALPGSVDELRGAVERRRGQPLALASARLPQGSCGLLIETDTVDVLIVNQAGSPMDRLQAVTHQLAHLLYGHEGVPDDHLASTAFPGLTPDRVSAFLTTSRYTPDEEHEADAYATQFVDHLTGQFDTSEAPPDLPLMEAQSGGTQDGSPDNQPASHGAADG
jgi:hypothetical protein